MVVVRTVTAADAEGLLSIYGPHVLNDAITFETQIPSVEDFGARITKCLQKFPWLVCETKAETAGYVYASLHRERDAYQWTCECSVYVHDDHKGKGIGANLYRALFQILKIQGLVNLYAGITLPNEASVRLHEKCGFEAFARYENIGYKLGKWHSVGWWRLQLNNHEPKPLPPTPFSELNPSLYKNIFDDAAGAIKMKMVKGK